MSETCTFCVEPEVTNQVPEGEDAPSAEPTPEEDNE